VRAARRTAGGLVALVVLLTGCSGPAVETGGRAVPPPPPSGAGSIGAAATTTQAAELRAGLTGQLVERTFLLAQARATVLASGGSRSASPVRAVEQLLERREAELARTVGGSASALVPALQSEVDRVLAPGLTARGLAEDHARTAELLARRGPTLSVPALSAALDASTVGLLADPPRPDAARAGIAAGLVANALAAQEQAGSTETSAVVLRADLTRLLVSRAFLAGAPVDDPALDLLTRTLAARLTPSGGTPGVLAALRAGHTALFVAAQAAREGDDAGRTRAAQALLAADHDLAARLAAADRELPADLVLRELDPVRGLLLAAVGARASRAADGPSLTSSVAARSVVSAAALSAALADQGSLR
jgi:hypothetical protein